MAKTGRNKLCSCGSGIKFKRCCLKPIDIGGDRHETQNGEIQHYKNQQRTIGNSRGMIFSQNTTRGNGLGGILITNNISCPILLAEEYNKYQNFDQVWLTRHFNSNYMTSNRNGYFHFGTTSGYNSKDQQKNAARLSDPQEGRLQFSFHNPEGQYEHAKIGTNVFKNNNLYENGREMVVEYLSNDYCACFSNGDFDLKRAKKFREEKNPDIDAYVVYNLKKLILALNNNLSKRDEYSDFQLIGSRVSYDIKDVGFTVGKSFSYPLDQDLKIKWFNMNFVKSLDFAHEDEFRLLFMNPNLPGRLNAYTPKLEITSDESIAATIVDYGTF
jgi:SEC-C motif